MTRPAPRRNNCAFGDYVLQRSTIRLSTIVDGSD